MIHAVDGQQGDRPRQHAPRREHEAGGDHDDALGARADADVAAQAERLGARRGCTRRATSRRPRRRRPRRRRRGRRARRRSAIAASMKPSPTRSVVESRKAPNGVDLPPARASAPSRMSRIEPATKTAAPSQKKSISLRLSKRTSTERDEAERDAARRSARSGVTRVRARPEIERRRHAARAGRVALLDRGGPAHVC